MTDDAKIKRLVELLASAEHMIRNHHQWHQQQPDAATEYVGTAMHQQSFAVLKSIRTALKEFET